ncbi:response regulator [Marinobacter sp. M216]|uniref:Response regulator n=1 Tax=Marinobacter albus TaxID=3030833 RepID=A0ABT7HEA6_9GAMM|nr:response regulator [Marinobacter sp. M216]MDK9558691.1 response regulator [Marinobacter sp. M216]
MENTDEFDSHRSRLEQLRDSYLEKLPGRLDRMEYLVMAIPVDGDYREDGGKLRSSLNTIYQEAHKIAGAAGSLGLLPTSRAAKQMLGMVDAWFDASAEDPVSKQEAILALVRAMRDVEITSEPELGSVALSGSRSIHIVEEDDLVAGEILHWLEEAGFDARVFMSATVYGDTFEILPPPDLIIMNISFGDDACAGPRIIRFLKQKLGNLPPVVFLSARDDMDTRLDALRAGASRYLTQPVRQNELVDVAREYADIERAPAFRVLMVDDDEAVLAVNQLVLERAGLEVRTVVDPKKALEAAKAFEPDVVILDVLMPEVSGIELAAILRQDRFFDPIPILFLTSDTHSDQKVMSAALGGDDYINKPFDPDYLLTTIFARARRSRRLRELLRQSQTTGIRP